MNPSRRRSFDHDTENRIFVNKFSRVFVLITHD